MKKLFIYYSLTGSGDTVANYLKDKEYDIRKVTEKFKMPKSFFFRVLIGGFRAGINSKSKLVNFDKNISDYDEIVIGSPIWNSRLTPAINQLLKEIDLTNKNVSFILYSGSGFGEDAVKVLNEKYQNPNIILLKEPSKYHEELDKLSNL